MEQPKLKLICTASCQGEGVHMRDILSNLPDQVAHYILSFLAIKDLTRFGCVSRRCRELYLSTPSLNFDEFSSSNTSSCYRRRKLFKYLGRLFIHRGNNKIQCFRVRWHEHNVENFSKLTCLCFCENFQLATWIENAVRCNVEMLDLKMILIESENYLFPPCVFFCGSLRSLVVKMNHTMLFKTPSCGFSSNLKYLELRNVCIEDEGFFQWVSCSCKCIEEIHLQELLGITTIAIESSSLKKFSLSASDDVCHVEISAKKLEDICIGWTFESLSNKSLNIYAPELKSLKWGGSLMNRPSLGKLDYLMDAEIFLYPKGTFDNAFEVLCSLRRAMFLSLTEAMVKAAFRQGSKQAPLFDAISLNLKIGYFIDELVPAMVSLLRGMPLLSVLILQWEYSELGDSELPIDGSELSLDDSKSNTFEFNVGYWKLQNLAFIDKIMTLTIDISCSNGIEFATYVLECAPRLQKMTVIYLPLDLEKITLKLQECKKIYDAAVFIQNKQTKEEKRFF